ncbi:MULTISPECIES: histidine kinase dimerization/phosphoacceptor domain -containing protein [unclassified Sphingomonas]|uniref:histidine kinase dimerization/phosphoacceptor domain -containing protein n=1 Tax=unclassified Sphingomonas TaxID=196159 RepID=UPI00226AD5AE|nr:MULTISPECIES: histidine kinase dimerization/phosphoacceptor domain -containing protein [unclassified Sphingomonas]
MATTMPGEQGLDLTDCDREPIHIPGAIQPHGLLLIAGAAGDHPVVAGAGDIEGLLAPDWLGMPLADLIGQDVSGLLGASTGSLQAVAPRPVTGLAGSFSASVHRAGKQLMVELEPLPDAPMTAAATLAWLDAVATGFERASTVPLLCERAAVAFRALTGFDRVMIYQFLDDDAGRVVAEDKIPELDSFLNHHFPASDIPRQARALYVRNRTRAIPTVDYVPAPVRPAAYAGADLSDVALRSVSPIHLQYLHNMGVAASASISIVKDGLLWGLVACHHCAPRQLPPDIRSAGATLASGLARQIHAKEEALAYRERLRLRAAEDLVVPRLNREEPLRRAVQAVKGDLQAMMGADGFALVDRGTVATSSHCPPDGFVADLADWVQARGGEPLAVHELGATYPAAIGVAAASGVIAVPLIDEDAVLIWFRTEQIEEMEWAGNPHKAVNAEPGKPLSPRASFDSWTETVRGRSRRWTLEEVEAAHRLRRRFHEARQFQEVRRLNRELGKSLAEKDALLAQKDVLMKEVNHRVQNSLQLVASFLRLQAKSSTEPAVGEHLAEAQARLAAVALVHRRLYRDDQVESVDLSRYIDELVADMKTSLGADWAAQMRLDLAPVLVPTDRAVNIGLILTELVINATKYAYGGAAGPISIALEQHRTRLRLIVADEGGGKGDGEGFGGRMMAAMVQRLDGEIDFGDNAPGLRVIMTAPIGEPQRLAVD